jgi:hypothetical protein
MKWRFEIFDKQGNLIESTLAAECGTFTHTTSIQRGGTIEIDSSLFQLTEGYCEVEL